MIVHDMRSPLQVIKFFLDQLAPEEINSPDFEENLVMTRDVSDELCDMVSSLLDVSRLESGKMPLRCESVDLLVVAQSVIKRLGGLAGEHRIELPSLETPVIAYCDPEITGRILQNLLGNALKFTPIGGSIRIDISQEDPWTRLSISDTGPGIPAAFQKKVFQKFCQVDAQKQGLKRSTGLGLTFCKLATEAHGGTIELESEPGHGTTFHVRLPRNGASLDLKNRHAAKESFDD